MTGRRFPCRKGQLGTWKAWPWLRLIRLIGLEVAAVGVLLVTVFPFVWMLSSALKTPDLIFRYPPVIIPPKPAFSNFVEVFRLAPFGRYLFNSGFVATTVTVVALWWHSMAAYALARLRFPGRNLIFLGIVSTMMIPFYTIMIPLFLLVRWLGWLNTYQGLIVPAIPHAFGIFMLRQFYLSLPADLEDAARIDGCSIAGIYRHVALPLAKPVMAALAVFFFLANWDAFMWPLLVTSSPEMRVVQLGVVQFIGQYGRSWNLVMASTTVAIMPTLVLFFALQRYLVEGIKLQGLKF